MTRLGLTALLYAALALAASPAPALDAGTVAELEALREGDMRKLVIHDTPQAPADITFQTLDGAEHRLTDSDGKIRIVNFWATWCAPCRAEKPALDALNQDLSGPDFEVIAIATGRNSPAGIAKFNADVGVESLKTFVDPRSAAARQMRVLGLPVSVILDRDGNEIARLQGGADWTSASTRAILARLMTPEG
ncbi:MAG: TlpA disulfide reductase family protein [Pseudomonadota bacterium]